MSKEEKKHFNDYDVITMTVIGSREFTQKWATSLMRCCRVHPGRREASTWVRSIVWHKKQATGNPVVTST